MRRSSRIAAIVIVMLFLATALYPTVSAATIGSGTNVDVKLDPGAKFTDTDDVMNLANTSEIKTTWDTWVEDWSGAPPVGIFYGSYFKAPRLATDYVQGFAINAWMDLSDYMSFPRKAIMTGAWEFWVKSPLNSSGGTITFSDVSTGQVFSEQEVFDANGHHYAKFYVAVLPEHLYKFNVHSSPSSQIEASHDPIYDSKTEMTITETYSSGGGYTYQYLTKEYPFEADWSFVFTKSIGNDGLFGYVADPFAVGGHFHLTLRGYVTVEEDVTASFFNVFFPFVCNQNVSIAIDFPYSYPDIPSITTRNGYFASTDTPDDYIAGDYLVTITMDLALNTSVVLLCSADMPKETYEWTVNGALKLYFSPFLYINVTQDMIGTITNYGNSTNAFIIDTGYSQTFVFTDTHIYTRVNQNLTEFIIQHDDLITTQEEQDQGFVDQIIKAIGDFVGALWDGVQTIAGWIWTGLMKIAELIIGFANFVWGLIVSFVHMLVMFFGDLVHNAQVLLYAFAFILPQLVAIVGVSYGSRVVYYEEE